MATSTEQANGTYTLNAPTPAPVDNTVVPSAPAAPTPPTPAPVSATPTPISVTGLGTPQTPVTLPTPPTPTNPVAVNSSVPIPTIQSIVDANTAPTATDTLQSSILGKIATLTGGQESLATQQDTAENAAGVPALNTTLTELNSQLEGLNDQATKLQNDAAYTIPNTVQNSAAGRGITAAGLAPMSADALRANQIQQGAVATQALTLKAAVYAAQGQYSNAKDAADKAAQVAFDGETQQINYQQALLAQIQPQLTKEQAAQAATLKAELDDRTQQIATQQDNFKTGQALAITAMQNNASDPTAQFNAQQALKLDPTDPQYLQKVAALVGQYQTDQVKTQLDEQLTKAQIGEANATANKTNIEATLETPGANGQVAGTTGNAAVDATQPGYSSTPVAGGLTQASIDQKALFYITSGTVPPQGRTGASGLQNAAISNRMAEMDPNGNLAANKTQLKALSSSLTQQTQYLNSTQRAFNTANSNLATLTQFMTQAGVNTSSSIPLINSLTNSVKSGALDPGTISGYQAAIAGLRAEYAQVLSRGGEVTEGQRSQANSLIPDNLTPAQLQQVADRLNAEGTNAVNEAQSQVQQIQGQINGIITPPAGKGTQSASDFVASTLKAQGLDYTSVMSQIPTGQKGVIDNATGQVGSIPPSEYDPSKYTAL